MPKLMLALDVLDESEAIKISEETSEYVDCIKIGYPLVLATDLGIIKRIKEKTNKEVICDFKVADIPATNEKIARLTLNYADGIICQGFVGLDSVKAIINVAEEYKQVGNSKKVIMVTEMSHEGAKSFMQPIANEIAKMAGKLNVDGIVAPSTRPTRLKELKEIANNAFVISPGVGAQGGDLQEVLKVLDENDYVIVGRAIYLNENPKESAKKYKELL
ncbi:orotidine-5'-phosphate decarboxylase [Methanococcus voltae]|uniref:Orotidine 5'-phosphate decarboxylase n=1 Tax=Methanococcus voltae (strain ATCC BAA-1334 / A3) TaxID=456320 RepID=D7DTF8_METV3|nr:orotidine-5'-phosphate decarboxylase [Methanococcus voltae]MCS3901270.1 orotidine-5'-phosphate decarboxylase [Methanococcus voltae]